MQPMCSYHNYFIMKMNTTPYISEMLLTEDIKGLNASLFKKKYTQSVKLKNKSLVKLKSKQEMATTSQWRRGIGIILNNNNNNKSLIN